MNTESGLQYDGDYEDSSSSTMRKILEKGGMLFQFFEDDDNEFNNDNEEDEVKEERTNYTNYLSKDGKYFGNYPQPTVHELAPGYYKFISNRDLGVGVSKFTIEQDELFILPYEEIGEILADIQKFWASEERYAKYNFIHKRGILMHGYPGNGKTSIINLIANELVHKHKGLVFTINSPEELNMAIEFLPNIHRVIEPNTSIIVTIEDVDSILHDFGHTTKSSLLNFLDGIHQVNNVVFIATTNFPEQLEKNIVDRPSRFDLIYEIKNPNANVRREYFKNKILQEDLKEIDLEDLVEKTDGLTLSHIKEAFISIFILGNTVENTINRLKAQNVKGILKSDSKSSGFSFGKK